MPKVNTRLIRTIGASCAVLAVFVSAQGAAQAASTNNPLWRVSGSLLSSGTAAQLTSNRSRWSLTELGQTIECSSSQLKSGSTIIGTKAPTAGSGSIRLSLGECVMQAAPHCKVNSEGTITSEPLTATLAYATQAAAIAETSPNLLVLEPSAEKPGTFLSFNLLGEECGGSAGEHFWRGSLALEMPQGETELQSHTIVAPQARIGTAYVNASGITVSKKVGLTDGGAVTTLSGSMKVELTSKALWSVLH